MKVKVLVALSCPTLCDSMELTKLLCPWDSPGKNTGVGCYSILQGICPTQGSNPGLLHCRQILCHLSYRGGPKIHYFKVSFALTYFHVSRDNIDKEILDLYCFLVLLSIKQPLKWSEVKWSHSVMSYSLWPRGLEPIRLLCPWDSPGKNTGVGCHFLLQGSSQPRDRTQVSCIVGRFFAIWATGEVQRFIISK